LSHAMKSLNVRERHILTERRLKDEPTTLEALSKEYGVTRERVRQIEVRAFEKVQRAIKHQAIEQANRHDGDAVGAVRSIQRESLAASLPPNGELK
jgi:DNA-directed RNA polymerase sigma subunit (sigma70/sigma32)